MATGSCSPATAHSSHKCSRSDSDSEPFSYEPQHDEKLSSARLAPAAAIHDTHTTETTSEPEVWFTPTTASILKFG